MGTKVKLDDIIDGMEFQSFDNIRLLNIKNGEVVHLLREFLMDAEDGKSIDGLPNWHQEQIELAYDIIEHEDNYIGLPTEFDIHEYSIIEDFCFTVENRIVQDTLLHAIRGKGAFRRFKDKIFDLDLEQDWFAYRDQRYRQIAIEFCKKHNLKYE